MRAIRTIGELFGKDVRDVLSMKKKNRLVLIIFTFLGAAILTLGIIFLSMNGNDSPLFIVGIICEILGTFLTFFALIGLINVLLDIRAIKLILSAKKRDNFLNTKGEIW